MFLEVCAFMSLFFVDGPELRSVGLMADPNCGPVSAGRFSGQHR